MAIYLPKDSTENFKASSVGSDHSSAAASVNISKAASHSLLSATAYQSNQTHVEISQKPCGKFWLFTIFSALVFIVGVLAILDILAGEAIVLLAHLSIEIEPLSAAFWIISGLVVVDMALWILMILAYKHKGWLSKVVNPSGAIAQLQRSIQPGICIRQRPVYHGRDYQLCCSLSVFISLSRTQNGCEILNNLYTINSQNQTVTASFVSDKDYKTYDITVNLNDFFKKCYPNNFYTHSSTDKRIELIYFLLDQFERTIGHKKNGILGWTDMGSFLEKLNMNERGQILLHNLSENNIPMEELKASKAILKEKLKPMGEVLQTLKEYSRDYDHMVLITISPITSKYRGRSTNSHQAEYKNKIAAYHFVSIIGIYDENGQKIDLDQLRVEQTDKAIVKIQDPLHYPQLTAIYFTELLDALMEKKYVALPRPGGEIEDESKYAQLHLFSIKCQQKV